MLVLRKTNIITQGHEQPPSVTHVALDSPFSLTFLARMDAYVNLADSNQAATLLLYAHPNRLQLHLNNSNRIRPQTPQVTAPIARTGR